VHDLRTQHVRVEVGCIRQARGTHKGITGLGGGTGQQPHVQSTLVSTDVSQIFGPPTGGISTNPTERREPTDDRPEDGGNQLTRQQRQSIHPLNNDIFKTAAEQLKMLKQTLPLLLAPDLQEKITG